MLAIINYALASVAILATVVLMGGGLLWLTSRGDSGQIGKAKGLIGGSLTGMLLLLCSWIILNTINPELTKFKSIDAQVVTPKNYELGCCEKAKNGKVNIMVEKADCENGFNKDKVASNGFCQYMGCCIVNLNSSTTCFTILESGCSSKTWYFKKENCNEINVCKKANDVNCKNISDGDKPLNKALMGGSCYNHNLYTGRGLKDEPCGKNPKTGTCVAGILLDPCPDGYSRSTGGRDCGTGLYCCYKE